MLTSLVVGGVVTQIHSGLIISLLIRVTLSFLLHFSVLNEIIFWGLEEAHWVKEFPYEFQTHSILLFYKCEVRALYKLSESFLHY